MQQKTVFPWSCKHTGLPTSEFLGVSSGLRRGLWLSAVFPFLLRREPKKDIWSSQADVQVHSKTNSEETSVYVCDYTILPDYYRTWSYLRPCSLLITFYSSFNCALLLYLCSPTLLKGTKKREKNTNSKPPLAQQRLTIKLFFGID